MITLKENSEKSIVFDGLCKKIKKFGRSNRCTSFQFFSIFNESKDEFKRHLEKC